jgi:F-type H+-transporting ATPase subunit b
LKRWTRIGPIAGAVVLTAACAVAAEQGGGENAAAAWKDFMWRVINFVLFAAIIYKLAWKRIKDFFAGRRQQIASELKNLQDRKAGAEQRLAEVEKSIADIDKERQEILDQAREQGEALKASIVEKAHSEARKIQEQAQAKAVQERQQMIQDIRSEMADQIIESAEKLIVDKLKKKDQEKLIDDYLTKVVLN